MAKKIKIMVNLLVIILFVCFWREMKAEANDTWMSEQQVMEQAKQLMEEAREKRETYAILDYEIENIYPCDFLFYCINDYRDGKTVSRLLSDGKNDLDEITVRYWRLPYKNSMNEECLAEFKEVDGELSLVRGRTGLESTYDIKLKDGKYEEISLNEVEEVRYIELLAYWIQVIYVRMKSGTEYMIPYQGSLSREINKFEDGKVYTVKEFFDQMYNYYDEPTKEEIEQKKEEYEKTGEILVGGGAVVREVPLNQMNFPENTPKTLSLGLITGISSIFVVFFAVVFVVVRKYRVTKINFLSTRKDKEMLTIENIKHIVKLLFLMCVVMLINVSLVFAESDFSEQEVMEQAELLMEKEREREDVFAVSTYDVADIYLCESLSYVINDYRAGMTVPQMLENAKDDIENVGIMWRLPYKNLTGDDCLAEFRIKNGAIKLVRGATNMDSTFDMKLKAGKYDEISLNDVEEVRYIELSLYTMCVTYVRMKNGVEYMIPYECSTQREINQFEDGKVYEINAFFDQMYNYYDEPTKEEIEKAKAEVGENENNVYGGRARVREVPLEQLDQSEQNATNSTLYGAIGFFAMIILIGLTVKWKRDEKKIV